MQTPSPDPVNKPLASDAPYGVSEAFRRMSLLCEAYAADPVATSRLLAGDSEPPAGFPMTFREASAGFLLCAEWTSVPKGELAGAEEVLRGLVMLGNPRPGDAPYRLTQRAIYRLLANDLRKAGVRAIGQLTGVLYVWGLLAKGARAGGSMRQGRNELALQTALIGDLWELIEEVRRRTLSGSAKVPGDQEGEPSELATTGSACGEDGAGSTGKGAGSAGAGAGAPDSDGGTGAAGGGDAGGSTGATGGTGAGAGAPTGADSAG